MPVLPFRAVDQPAQLRQLLLADSPVFDQMPNQRHGITAEQSLDQVINRLTDYRLRLRLCGINPHPSLQAGIRIAFGFEATQVSLNGGKVDRSVGGDDCLVHLTHAGWADLPEDAGDLHLTSGQRPPLRHRLLST